MRIAPVEADEGRGSAVADVRACARQLVAIVPKLAAEIVGFGSPSKHYMPATIRQYRHTGHRRRISAVITRVFGPVFRHVDDHHSLGVVGEIFIKPRGKAATAIMSNLHHVADDGRPFAKVGGQRGLSGVPNPVVLIRCPTGCAGAAVAKSMREAPRRSIVRDLRRAKRLSCATASTQAKTPLPQCADRWLHGD